MRPAPVSRPTDTKFEISAVELNKSLHPLDDEFRHIVCIPPVCIARSLTFYTSWFRHFLVPLTQNITLGLDPHNFKLTAKNSSIAECDFITRMLFKDVY